MREGLVISTVLMAIGFMGWARSAWQTCNECWNSGTAEIVYPCPTVAAIRTALGEGEK